VIGGVSTYIQAGAQASLGPPRRPELSTDSFQEHLSYWKERLAGCSDFLALPTDRPRPANRTFQQAQQTGLLPDALIAGLHNLADQEHATLFEVLFSAFQTLLHRYTGSQDIVTGSSLPLEPVETVTPFRTDLSGDPQFRDLLARVRADLREAHEHKDVPLEKLIEALGLERSGSYSPLFQVTFQLRGLTEDADGLSRLIDSLESEPNRGDFDLSMEVRFNALGSYCALSYNPDLFEATTIQRMLGHYQAILEAVVRNPHAPISRLPILTETERHELLVEWNDTRADYPRTCVHRLFEEQVRRTPAATAVAYENRALTYAELNAEANRLAHALKRLGVGPNVTVGLCIERSVEMVVGLLAVLKAGGAYAPLDPAYPKARLAFMLADLQAPVLLCRNRSGAHGLSQYTGVVLAVDEWRQVTAHESPEDPVSEVEPEDLAYVLYTSGSTGEPKGVLIPHRALVNYLTWCMAAYSGDQGIGSPVHTPIGFDLTITSLFPPLLAGRCAVLVREDPTLETLTAALRTGDFSLVKLTPAHLEALSHKLASDKQRLLTRTFVIGGEALLGETLGFWRKQSPAIRLINEYGPTEATVGCCVYEVPVGAVPSSSVPIGRPIANTRLYVLDRNLQPVPIGVPGELYIAGDGLALGYHRRAELTAEKFIPDPFSSDPEARMYKTGDLVRHRPDGNLEFLGRLDYQVKIRGFRVELNEIESALVGHTDVREAVVVASEGVPGDRRLLAYIVPAQRAALTELQLRNFLKQKLPDYMLPARYVFLDSMPLTSNGKVDRRALPAPDRRQETHAEPLDGPRDALESQLVKIWEEILRAKTIGMKEDFFELGGNSLLAIRMLARVEKTLNTRVTLATLMFAPTIERLAAMLRDPNSLRRPQVFGIQPYGLRPPFFCVGAGPLFRTLANRLGPDQPFLGVPLPDMNTFPTPYCMEDIVAHCVETLRQVQPHGPYLLGGWSDAGVMAYEMAQQLKRLGETVALVVLFDAENQSYRSDVASSSLKKRTHFLGQWLRLQCRTLLNLQPRERVPHVRRRLAFRLAWLKGLAWGVAYRIHLRAGWSFHHGLHNIEYVSAFASQNYQPRPYDGRVLLFRRTDRPAGEHGDPAYGWGHIVNGLEIHEVPGNHIDMFLEPNVPAMADKLRQCLLKAQEIGTPTAAGAH
jgi:amino acid adenylation domain-containing protein